MTPAEEDALAERTYLSICNFDGSDIKEPIRLAIRAAVAAERERCARVCEHRYMGDNNREDMEARRCAAAIRKGD